jgi:hypothetical protein
MIRAGDIAEYKKKWNVMEESELKEEAGIQFRFKNYRKTGAFLGTVH